MNQTFEYITVNEGSDLWIIDYNEGEARHKSDSIEWMESQGIEIKDLGLDSIYSYLEDQNYIIHDGISSEDYIKFEKENE